MHSYHAEYQEFDILHCELDLSQRVFIIHDAS